MVLSYRGEFPCDFGCFGEISVGFSAAERIALADSGRGRFGSLARNTVWFLLFPFGMVDNIVALIKSSQQDV